MNTGAVSTSPTVLATNTELARLIDEAGLSKGELARHVVAAARHEGRSVGTTRATVNRMLAGSQPHAPVPQLVAVVLSEQLARPVTVADCGMRDTSPDEDLYDGLRVWPTLIETTRTVYELAGRDMRRRTFLCGSGFVAAAFAEPALLALTSPAPSASTAEHGRQQLGHEDAAMLEHQLRQLRRADQEFGAAKAREHVVRLVRHETSRLLRARFSEKVGAQMCSALAQATALAGWTAADTEQYALSQRYFLQALELAKRGDDRLYPANVLAHMGRQTIAHGERSNDHLRCGQQALALARAGLSHAGNHATPGLRALLHTTAARAHAALGEHRDAQDELTRARQDHERTQPGREPEWLSYTTAAEFTTDASRVLRESGHPGVAARLLQDNHRSYPTWQTRRRALVDLDLALTHVVGGDLDRAHHLGVQAAAHHQIQESAKGRDRLRLLQDRLAEHHYPARVLK